MQNSNYPDITTAANVEWSKNLLGISKTPSPSQLPLLSRCRASLRECANLPNISGEPAIEGNASHYAAELITNGEEPDAVKIAAQFGITKEVAESAIGRCWYARKLKESGWTVITERKVYIGLEGELVMEGTLDLALISPDGTHMIIPDQKSGRLDVDPAQSNLQLIAYGLGALDLPEAANVNHVTRAIIYSRFGNQDEFDAPASELISWLPTINRIVEEAMGDRANYRPGVHCEMCRAVAQCPATHQLMAQVHGGEVSLVDLKDVSIDKKRELFALWKIAGKFADASEKAFKALASAEPLDLGDGKEYGPVDGTKKSIIASKESFAELFEAVGAKYVEAVEVRNGPLEKMVMDAAPRGKKKEMKAQFWNDLTTGGFVEVTKTRTFRVHNKGEVEEGEE